MGSGGERDGITSGGKGSRYLSILKEEQRAPNGAFWTTKNCTVSFFFYSFIYLEAKVK